jgi:hypothetical protein
MPEQGIYDKKTQMRLSGRLLMHHLAWEFCSVLPGYFERNRAAWFGYKLPIIAPLPDAGPQTRPRVGAHLRGPFLYGAFDLEGRVLYIGKSREKWVTDRWHRPDRRTGRHYWSHGTTGRPSPSRPKTVERIAGHIQEGKGNIGLLFADHATISEAVVQRAAHVGANVDAARSLTDEELNDQVEAILIQQCSPPWNSTSPRVPPLMRSCGPYWAET